MKPPTNRLLLSAGTALLIAATGSLPEGLASAQEPVCPPMEITSGLRRPIGIELSNQGNLLVSETGTPALHSGRISIVEPTGIRRTLLDGLPSGISDVGDPAGPDGLYMRGRTIYVTIGIGDNILAGPVLGTATANPTPSSPIFSSVLAIHLSANAERITAGFTLTIADQETLASGQTLTLSNGGGDKLTIDLVANFPNSVPNPLPFFSANVAGSNPYDVVAVGDFLYVTDGGMNKVWKVDLLTGAFSTLTTFAPLPNPLFPAVGGPVMEAVPTGIAFADGQILVALLRGVPFLPGASTIQQIDPETGIAATLIGGRKTAIDVLPIGTGSDVDYLVLQHASVGLFFGSPGVLLRFEAPDAPPTVVVGCLDRPTSMVLDTSTSTLYVSELLTGRVVAIAIAP
jgi:hypothetical protein